MENLIPLINRIQDALASTGLPTMLDLPQIAVVGGQSAGKSSVLENFVGRDFLPRGSGIVTRRPLVLQLVTNRASREEYGEFVHCRGRMFTDFSAIRAEIEAETDRVTGDNKGISNLPINLRIVSPNVVNITLVDLPGLTKIPVGDQPKNIEKQVREMITEFISKETCLILAVTPANTDIATSDALQLAKAVDPQGNRTIGVLTKLDLMDEGTDARAVLENKLLPLKRGYVGVVNRSQKRIDMRTSIEEATREEANFFAKHPAYKAMADRLGSAYLQRVLNRQLTHHIKEALPGLKSKVRALLSSMEKGVEKYKLQGSLSDPGTATRTMLQMVQQLQQEFERSIEGHHVYRTDHARQVDVLELTAGVKINRIFHERFPYDIVMSSETDDSRLRKEIGFAISNTHGVRCGLFTPNRAFEAVVRRQVEKLKKPSFKCLDLVAEEIRKIVLKCTDSMNGFPNLRRETDSILNAFVHEATKRCGDQINFVLNCELAYVNTNHEDLTNFSEKKATKSSAAASTVSKGMDVGNEIIRKGFMSIGNAGFSLGSNKSFWFVLTTSSLSWYRDGDEKDKKFMLPLDDLRFKDVEQTGFLASRKSATFSLFYTTGKNVYKDWKFLELSCSGGQEEADFWKASFLRVGVYPQSKGTKDQDENNNVDAGAMTLQPQLERQVETIKSLVSSYMKIVTKTCRDIVPKTIMGLFIQKVKNFVHGDLTAQLYAVQGGDIRSLMQEGPEETARRDETMKQYAAAKEAMAAMSEASAGTATGQRTPIAALKGFDEMLSIDTDNGRSSMTASFSSHSLNAFAHSNEPSSGIASGRLYPTPPMTRHSASKIGPAQQKSQPPPLPPARTKAAAFTLTPTYNYNRGSENSLI